MIGDSTQFRTFMADGNDEECMDFIGENDDEKAHGKLCSLLNVKSGTELQSWDRNSRNEALRRLKEAGLSVRKIERLTGIGRNIIQRL